jgi:membrane protein YqaA with SNARE-associated domain
VVKHARGKRAVWWLSAVSFSESSFFPIPPDILLGTMLAGGAGKWRYYSAVTTVASVAGGVLGYAIGLWFFELFGQHLVSFYGLHEELEAVRIKFADSAFLTIFLAAFTPIPYKIFTIAAGLFRIDFLIFVIASLAGRSMRFFAFGYIMHRFGPRMGGLLFKYFNTALFAIAVIILISIVVILLL